MFKQNGSGPKTILVEHLFYTIEKLLNKPINSLSVEFVNNYLRI